MTRKKQQPIEHPSLKLSDRTIIRAKHDPDNPYFLMRRASAQDSRLSFEARGVLAYILSKSDNWKVRLADLRREGDFGKEKAQKLLRELEAAGYITWEKVRSSKGRFDWVVTVHEKPKQSKSANTSPQATLPAMVKPATAEPATANPAIYSLQNIESTELENTRRPPAEGGDATHRTRKSVSVGASSAQAHSKKIIALSRYSKKDIRRYVDSLNEYDYSIRNPGGFTHSLWLSGDADEDVAAYLRDDEKWLAKAPTKGLEIVLQIFPRWANTDNWKSWESKIKTLVISHFDLWENAIEEIRSKKLEIFPMEEAIDRYLEMVNEEIARVAFNAA